MNILKSLTPITRRALRIHYRSPMICALTEESSGSGASTVDTTTVNPVLRAAGPALTLVLDGSGVELSWTRVTRAYAYVVYRATAEAGPYSAIVTGTVSRTYVDNPGPGLFFYRVTAIEPNFGETTPSNTESVTV